MSIFLTIILALSLAVSGFTYARNHTAVKLNSGTQSTIQLQNQYQDQSDTMAAATNGRSLQSNPAARSARAALADRFNIGNGHVQILGVTDVDWPDPCLGLMQGSEICAQVVTPGYRVTLSFDGKMYIYRTNRDGTVVRAEDPTATSVGIGKETGNSDARDSQVNVNHKLQINVDGIGTK